MVSTPAQNTITLTAAALAQTHLFYEQEEAYRGKDLRLYLDGKGCDGFFYGVTFDERSADDHVFAQDEQVNIIVDSDTLEFVQGSSIDWIDGPEGKGYLVNNPHHRKFRGKFFRRSSWQKSKGIQ